MRPLPEAAARLLERYQAPPRLVAHLTLVHDVACTLIEVIDRTWPMLEYDRESVYLGAAIHDIGKTLIPRELTEPGHEHEVVGEELLLQAGTPAYVARFARTHAQWTADPDARLEDMLVALADRWWRSKRDRALESAVCAQVMRQAGKAEWDVFIGLDDIAISITAGADMRLEWQAQHPTT